MKTCVTIVCDQGFLAPATFIARQLLQTADRTFDIIICSPEDLTPVDPALDVTFRRIAVDDFINDLPASGRLKHFTYWRLPALESLAQDYDRIVYLDADIFVAGTSIARLLTLDLQGAVIGAVRDVHQQRKPNRQPLEFKALGLPTSPYLNAGVLIVDGAAWRAQGSFAQIRKIAIDHPNALNCHDQSLLNLAFRNNWAEISPIWNWQYSRRNCYLTEYVCPELIHFAGATKIWGAATGDIPAKYVAAYHNAPMKHATTSFPSLWKSAYYAPRILRDLNRFATADTVLRHRANP